MRIENEYTAALIIDFQEKLFPHIFQNAIIQKNVSKLIEGLKILGIPILITEQYPKGLGSTILSLKNILSGYDSFEKISFSCCDADEIMSAIQKLNRNFIIIAGIEAHVCVMQTVIDLIYKGFTPVVVTDCISSRKENDKVIAIERFKNEGAILSTYESVLFELCRVAGSEKFKSISAIVK
jgi:nicotinamidase-related amidase